MSLGMVTWSAVVICARGEWAKSVARYALSGIVMTPVLIVALAALWRGYAQWAVWINYDLYPKGWLNPAFLFARDFGALLLLTALAWYFLRRRRSGVPRATGAWLILCYCAVMTLFAFDLIMTLQPGWYSTLFGGYYFISGLYAAIVMWTLVVLLTKRKFEVDVAHDMGKLIVAFSLLMTYMLFSQLIVIWYENLPEERDFVVSRLHWDTWRWTGILILVIVYLGPLLILLTRWAKRTPWFLGGVSALLLVCLWIERWWLVSPSISDERTPNIYYLPITIAFSAIFAFGVTVFLRRVPPFKEEAETE
jgi:hypothetical protein